MDVIVTGYIGITGTAILARWKKDELSFRFPKSLVREMTDFDSELEDRYESDGQLREIRISLSQGAVYAKEYREFGILEALYSMAKELGVGLRINIRDIPIKQETVEVSEFVRANPYELFSGASAVIVCDNGNEMTEILEAEGIPAFIVGTTTLNNDKLLINGDEESFIPHVRKDELKRILGRKEYERANSVNT